MKRAFYVLLVVLPVVFLDQFTKYLVATRLSPYDSIELFPFLQIINIRNTGAAFGAFRGAGSGFFIVISSVAILFVISLLIKNIYNSFGLSLVLGGAIGNLIDRISYGKVVDFIDFHIDRFHFHWPAFNVADSALTVGVIILLVTSLLHKNEPRKERDGSR